MMPFGFKVRDMQTGQYPTMGKAALRGFIWVLEVGFTVCIIGAIGWLWQLGDPQKQAIHDKIAGTIVTTNSGAGPRSRTPPPPLPTRLPPRPPPGGAPPRPRHPARPAPL